MMDPGDMVKTPPVVHDLAGRRVGRFLLQERIGAGGMGQVYRAEDTILKRIVAIKRMAPQLQFDERDRERFLKEAQRASALSHPNIAAIHDVIEERGEILLVMEYIEGQTLRRERSAATDQHGGICGDWGAVCRRFGRGARPPHRAWGYQAREHHVG